MPIRLLEADFVEGPRETQEGRELEVDIQLLPGSEYRAVRFVQRQAADGQGQDERIELHLADRYLAFRGSRQALQQLGLDNRRQYKEAQQHVGQIDRAYPHQSFTPARLPQGREGLGVCSHWSLTMPPWARRTERKSRDSHNRLLVRWRDGSELDHSNGMVGPECSSVTQGESTSARFSLLLTAPRRNFGFKLVQGHGRTVPQRGSRASPPQAP